MWVEIKRAYLHAYLFFKKKDEEFRYLGGDFNQLSFAVTLANRK